MTFQQTESEYRSTKAQVKGIEAQLQMFGVNLNRIRNGNIYEQVPLVSPIKGYVEKVNVKLGQFVPQEKELFEIINTEHVHADLMVFEKDVAKVRVGQTVEFSIESMPDTRFMAKIFSVGKTFEQDPKAVHVHADIEDKVLHAVENKNRLVPGMYLNGKILTSENKVTALPEEAIITEKGAKYMFAAKTITEAGEEKWEHRPVKIMTGEEDDGWIEVKLLQALNNDEKLVLNNTYYLISEMKKGETGHSH